MGVVQMADRILLRSDKAINWTIANPTLYFGETGVEVDTRKIKIGDGKTAWNDLDYMVATGGLNYLKKADEIKNGYKVFSDDSILQWGEKNIVSQKVDIYFPISFKCLNIQVSVEATNIYWSENKFTLEFANIIPKKFNWYALGVKNG